MNCPHCGYKMAIVNYDHQTVLHCTKCNGSFFEENGINRISEKTARILASDSEIKENNVSVSADLIKVCPKHGAPLKLLTGQEAIPQHVSLYECPACQGIFVLPQDLLTFKTAQDAKVNYLKSWNIPFPSIRAVMVLGVFLFISVLSFTTYMRFSQPELSRVQADEVINGFYSTVSNQLVFIYFKTSIPVSSEVIFEDRTTGEVSNKTINALPVTTHSLTTGDVNTTHEIYYTIVIRDRNNIETHTALKKLELR